MTRERDEVTVGGRPPGRREVIALERDQLSGRPSTGNRDGKGRQREVQTGRAVRPRWLVPVAASLAVVAIVGIAALTLAGGDDDASDTAGPSPTNSSAATTSPAPATDAPVSTDAPSTELTVTPQTEAPTTLAATTTTTPGLGAAESIVIGIPLPTQFTPPLWIVCSPTCVAVAQFNGDYFMRLPLVGGAASQTVSEVRPLSCGDAPVTLQWTYSLAVTVTETTMVAGVEVPTRIDGTSAISAPEVRSESGCIQSAFQGDYTYTGHEDTKPRIADNSDVPGAGR